MKKRYLPIFAFLMPVFSSIAQNPIVITESSIVSSNQSLQMITDTFLTSYANGQAVQLGANVSWDLSSLSNDVVKNVDFMDPTTMSDYSLYSSSNLGLKTSDNFDVYLHKSTNGIGIVGIVGDVANLGVVLKAKLTPEQTLLSFPSTYQTTFTNVSTASASTYHGQNESFIYNGVYYTFFVDSFKAEYTYNISSEIDGYGTLTTPAGTFQALRQKVEEVQVDTHYAYIQGTGWFPFEYETITEYKLRWWVDGMGYPAVECAYNPTNNKVKNVTYLTMSTVITGLQNLASSTSSSIYAYPNPSTDFVSFHGISENVKAIELFDVTGKKVKEFNNIAQGNFTIAVNDLNKGFYTYSIISMDNQKMASGKLSVTK